jgi:hypothetical protein
MGSTSVFRTLLNIIIILLLPASLWAITPMHDKENVRDSLNRQQQEKEKRKAGIKVGRNKTSLISERFQRRKNSQGQ